MTKEAHVQLLGEIRSEISQHMQWRRKLFDHPDNTEFEITPESVEDTCPSLAKKIRAQSLKFVVVKNNGESLDGVILSFIQ
ncbi:hypothetical protein [Alteromonas sp. KUL49]|uniref:hypothetical protein n=1 Tax=Alteromonas sp. KUL49 TaxID=2480798 RepID=UPI00102F2479|nr:hypothetical protein [Alteromonas sp. KUL49]TAP40960.1 hypothetical protein EYS00_07590 [Alteromonas sp. KUL49]GEA11143.1 hypothetical protein KUL49_15180 [Alteromonas sp. KUL49]